ncbi:cytochrome oxidase assembly protein [Granulicella sp. 5B5]|nr:cytochrome oxidase assembly protein [Granulicella sp. 5B5]
MGAMVNWLRRGRGISGYAAFVVGFMVLVIVEGAVVRATGSGNGCGNHWPLCNGEIIPHHPRIATVIEYVHRSLTGVCTWLVVGLIAWVFMAREKGDIARRAVVWTGVLLLTEGALGAVLVKGGYVENNASTARVIVQGIHFSNTLLLLGAMTLTWWWLRGGTVMALEGRSRVVAWVALATTLLVGATGAVAALADTLFPSPDLQRGLMQDFAAHAPLLIRMRWLHPAASVIALACAVWLSVSLRSRIGRWVLGLIALQIVLGVTDVLLLAPTWMQVLHLLGADAYWIALVAACSGVFVGEERRRIAVGSEPLARMTA